MARKKLKVDVHAKSGFGLSILSDDQLDSIHQATLEVLQHTGLRVETEEAVEILHGSGASIERFGGYRIVKIPPHVVEDCIHWAPRSVTYCGRDPGDDFVAGSQRVGFMNGGGCVSIIDPFTREHRRTVLKDCGDIALACDYLETINILDRPCIPSDVPPETQPVHAFEAILKNTSKHTFSGSDTARNLRKMVELGAACLGGMDDFKKRPLLTASVCPTSPLALLRDCCEVVIEAAREGVGVWIVPMALAGATSTSTVAGTVVTTNAEVLGTIVLAQLTAKGTPCTYGNTSTIMDMRTGVGSVGAPELGLINSGAAKLARYYRLPSAVGSGMSDSKIPDAQAAYESTLSALTTVLAGPSVVFGPGGLDQLLTFDYAKLVMDAELIEMIEKVVRGIAVTDESMAMDVIHHVGPGGEFITHDHTLAHVREISQNKLFDRNIRDVWIAGGGKDLTERAYETARYVLQHHEPKPLPPGIEESLRSIVEEYDRKLGVSRQG